MELAKIFSTITLNSAKVVSRDSKIYEAFKADLLDTRGITLEEFMKNKDMRKHYLDLFLSIKSNFEHKKREEISDEQCLTNISKIGRQWKEFIDTAKDCTLDGGREFISTTPLEKYIFMSSAEKDLLEDRLVRAAVTRVRAFQTTDSNVAAQLDSMLSDKKNSNEEKNDSRGRSV